MPIDHDDVMQAVNVLQRKNLRADAKAVAHELENMRPQQVTETEVSAALEGLVDQGRLARRNALKATDGSVEQWGYIDPSEDNHEA